MQYFTPVQNLLRHSAETPNKIYLHQAMNRQWHEYSWADVEHQARCIASALTQQGFSQGDKIGILSKNCAHWVIADLGIMMAGMISVPIYPTANEKTISYVLTHANVKALFVGKLDDLSAISSTNTEDILTISFPFDTLATTTTFDNWLNEFSPLTDIHQPQLEDIATIIYTSGSTGVPKGVVLTHKNWNAAGQSTALTCELTSNERILSYLPLAHIVERSLEAISLYIGCQIYYAESMDTFISDMQYAKPTMFGSVPRLWTIFQANILEKLPQKKLDFLLKLPLINRIVTKKIKRGLGLEESTRFMSGTAPIPRSLLLWYHKIGIPISEGWGMTETSSMSCANIPFSEQDFGSIGTPLAGIEMKLSDESEILIRGDAVFSEYYLDNDTTQESFIDGWFHTGDCAEKTPSGAFRIIGRIKDKFKTSKGKYVAPVPIESALSANTDIEQICLIGSGFKQPIALVVLNPAIDRTSIETRTGLAKTLEATNKQLETHEVIEAMIICQEPWTVDNELLTPTLKIKRNVIESHYRDIATKTLTTDVMLEEDLH